jgi:hypothetical protein
MPPIYEGRCSACNALTERTFGYYEAVLLDEPADSARAHRENPYLVVLAHPNQFEILRELGFSYPAVHRAGRLVDIGQHFCLSCGRTFEVRRLCAGLPWFGLWGGLLTVVAMLAVCIVLALLIGGEWAGIVTAAGLFVLLLGMAEMGPGWYVRWRYSERAAMVATPKICPHCGDWHVAQLGPLTRLGTRVQCMACGEQTVKYRCVGTEYTA